MKKLKTFLVSSFMIMAVLTCSHMAVNAGTFVCGDEIHVMTQTYNQTLVRNYDHTYQYGTGHVKVEEVQKVTKFQCGSIMTVETISTTETHSMQH